MGNPIVPRPIKPMDSGYADISVDRVFLLKGGRRRIFM